MLARAVLPGAVLALAGAAASADDFYRGRTLTYVVATKPGGNYDTYGRLIARYMQKHLGADKVVVRNIPGAGHIVGANFIHAAKPDGLTIGTFNTGLIYAQVLRRKGVKFDLRRMGWIGKASTESRVVVVKKGSVPATIDALRPKGEAAKVAVSGIGSAAYNDMALLRAALRLNVRLVPGFSGNEAEMSVLRGEVIGTIGSRSSLDDFVANGHGVFVLEIGGRARPGLPQARDLVRDDRDRALVALIESQGELGRLTAGPPGMPAARLAALRAAYGKAVTDPGLVAEARKRGLPLAPAVGDAVGRIVDDALNQPPETVALVASVMNVEVTTVTVRTGLLSVGARGRTVEFMSGDTRITSAVSGSRTRVRIGGKGADRRRLRAGMNCTIEFRPGGENESRAIDCKATGG
jgi:tripartite-type tricarboxylate transporter receptor subunit TctC